MAVIRGLASIIVPCWNQVEFTRLCLDALFRHTRRPWELIVVDNGSTDGTAEFLAEIPADGRATVPVPRDVSPWVAIVERLWDDPAFEARHRALALAEARRWDVDTLMSRYDGWFRSLAQGRRTGVLSL